MNGIPFTFKQWGTLESLGEHSPKGVDAVVLRDRWNPCNRRGDHNRPEPHTTWNRDVNGRCGGSMGRAVLRRGGKKAAGRGLDGRTWDQCPDAVRMFLRERLFSPYLWAKHGEAGARSVPRDSCPWMT